MGDSVSIQVSGLRKVYRDGLLGQRRIDAVKGISFQVRDGEIFGLLGPNGAGKTTTVKMLLGIVKKSGGEALLLGKPAGDRASRRAVGYLPENLRIPLHHTGASALAYYGRLSGLSGAEIRRLTPGLLDLVGLSQWGKTRVKKYSKGMLQRLGLAQAMMHDPQVLVLDEPTDGVDPVGRNEIRIILKRLKEQGKTVLLNSHLLQEVELVCDRVVIMQHGEVLQESDVSSLTQRDGREMEMTVLAPDSVVEAALAGLPFERMGRSTGGELSIVIQADSQRSLDSYVDALRRSGVSITSIVRRRQTLEEAFLRLVGQKDRIP
ncbi:MAG: ABC transporter ATP-binding protein [Candidatus Hydrogenedentota bacterium]